MSAGDRLSSLPDDLLLRVLHFARAKEAKSTSALSRRWRGLWCSSGAVNLDERLPETRYVDDAAPFCSRRDAFVSAARSSLEAAAASGSAVTRLTFRLEAPPGGDTFHYFLCRDEDRRWRSPDVVEELLSLPAARRVEQLRLAAEYSGHSHRMPSDSEVITSLPTGLSTLKFSSLPSETLRVLDITGCRCLEPSAGVAFPRLASLRLSLCSVFTEHLQDFIHAAPALATVHLDSVMLQRKNHNKGPPPPEEEGLTIRLHCPAATALVLEKCCWAENAHGHSSTTAAVESVEIDAPGLRRFTYKGLLRRLSLVSQAPDMARVNLHIFPPVYYSRDRDPRRDLVTFWQLARNFSNAKELKLNVNSFEYIAVVGTPVAELLCSFPNLERLQLEGRLTFNEETTEVSIANLLQCCPVLRDLRINLTTPNDDIDRISTQGRPYLEKKYRHDLDRSIHGFKNRRSQPMVVSNHDDHDDDAIYDKLSERLPAALSGHVFHCLQTSLICVRLQFRLERNIFGVKLTNWFGVMLIKFFAENVMVLKEMHIDAGNGKMCGHINSKVQKWVANSSNKGKMNFTVLLLER